MCGLACCGFVVLAWGVWVALSTYLHLGSPDETIPASPLHSGSALRPTTPHLFYLQEALVDFVCISLPKRKASHFDPLARKLAAQGLGVQWFSAINGHDVRLADYPTTERYRKFFATNARELAQGTTHVDYRGHLGCTLSHLEVWRGARSMRVVLEDDVDLPPDFRSRFQQALLDTTAVDPNWDVLLLGWCCRYQDYWKCKANDREHVEAGGVVRVRFWIGGWGYVVRSPAVAQKILALFRPIDWHVDLVLAEAAWQDKPPVYGLVPTLTPHGGHLRISTFDHWQKGNPDLLKSDNNIVVNHGT